MSLSDGGRFTRIAYGIKRITDLKIPDFYPQSDVKKIKDLINNLWPSFLRNDSNNLFWILGGDFSSESLGEMSLLTAAFDAHEEEEEEEEEDSFISNDSFTICQSMLSPHVLCNDQEMQFFLDLWDELENLIYAISRYNDKFKESLKELEDNIHNLRGLLFKVISLEKKYSKVWMQYQLYNNLFSNSETFMGKWLVRDNLHHNLRIGTHVDDIIPYKDLKEMFVKWQFVNADKIPLFDQVTMIIKMMGRRFHYEHLHEQLISNLKKEKTISKEQLIEIKKMLVECIESNKKQEEENHKHYNESRYCHFTGKSGE